LPLPLNLASTTEPLPAVLFVGLRRAS